ncbi:MAG: hypothetical protein HRF52_13470 [Ignavibacterium sp.]|jgi:hypothetical protein|uniref:hypothetical protein n=1 Tax=Ignavibacterium sp. TaxID=2651167 RepID=UPI0032989E28
MKKIILLISFLVCNNLLSQNMPVSAVFNIDAKAMKSKMNVLGVNPLGFEIEFTFTVEIIDANTKKVLGRWGDKGTPPAFSKASIWNAFEWPISISNIDVPKECKKVELKYLLIANVSNVELGLNQMFKCKFAGVQGSKSISTSNWFLWKKKELNFGKINVKLECRN